MNNLVTRREVLLQIMDTQYSISSKLEMFQILYVPFSLTNSKLCRMYIIYINCEKCPPTNVSNGVI